MTIAQHVAGLAFILAAASLIVAERENMALVVLLGLTLREGWGLVGAVRGWRTG